MKYVLRIASLFVVALVLAWGQAIAYEVPSENSHVKYFYIFGPDGDPLMGAEDSELELFIDVPASTNEVVTFHVYDPDTGGFHDWRVENNANNAWDTSTKFSVYGATQLDSHIFGEDRNMDKNYFTFGPYDKTQGQRVGDYYRFRLMAQATTGDDQNLFKVIIAPENAEAYVHNMTFRLRQKEGDTMVFYPKISKNTSRIIVENYDLDESGGSSVLLEGAEQFQHPIKDSASGQWSSTQVDLSTRDEGRLRYVITKATQRNANAGLRIKDEEGRAIPIYFRKGPAPMNFSRPKAVKNVEAPIGKCNTFTFDATNSYDKDNEKITYLWDFGDGQTSTSAVSKHTFANAGDYTVTLAVTDNSGLVCNTAETKTPVSVNEAPVAVFDIPSQVCVQDEVRLDGSKSTDNTPETLEYSWDLGDGMTAEGSRIRKIYNAGGVYKIRLSVNDASNTACDQDAIERVIRVNTTPVSNAGDDISLCQKADADEFRIRFDGGNSYDKDKDDLSYSWDFGDGLSGKGKNPNHVYAKPGTYEATLTVSDSTGTRCEAHQDSVNVVLNRAPKAVAGQDVDTCMGSTVSFDAGMSSTDNDAGLTYRWDFGDGQTGTGSAVNHTYHTNGVYQATLTADDGRGSVCSIAKDALTVHVNAEPLVSIHEIEPSCAGDSISFLAMISDADEDNLKISWDFGDGVVKNGGAKVNHTYAKSGFYTVQVTATDSKGLSCSIASDTAFVNINEPPVANAGDNLACCVGESVDFDASGSLDPNSDSLSYYWSFGDGSTAQGVRTQHTYNSNGVFDVQLRVGDNSNTACSESTDGFSAVVNAKPVPIIEIR